MKNSKLLFACLLFTCFSYSLFAQSNDTYIGALSNYNIIFQTNYLQRMAILANGDVQFASLGSGTGLVTFDSSGIIKPLAFNGNVNTVLTGNGSFTNTSSFSPWQINGSNVYYTGGNIGIGTSTPNYALQIIGNVYDSGTMFATNIAVKSNILVGNFRLINGTLTGGSDTIASQGNIHIATDTVEISGKLTAQAVSAGTDPFSIAINGNAGTITSPSQTVSFANDTIATTTTLKATSINISGNTVKMPGIATDTITDLMTIDPHGNVTPLSPTAVNNLISGLQSNNMIGASSVPCASVGTNNYSWAPTTTTNSHNAVWTIPCTWVGIGTETPNAPLNISNNTDGAQFSISNPSNGNNMFSVDGSGNTYAAGNLEVVNNLSIYTSNGGNSLFFGQDQIPVTSSPSGKWGIQYLPAVNNPVSGAPGGLNFWVPSSPGYNKFGNGYLWLSDNGNVGIGTTNPRYPLDVNGIKIAAGQVVNYTSFNAPSFISLQSTSMTFNYGPDNNREKTILTEAAGTTTRYYAQDYEKTVDPVGNTTEVNYIQCGGELVAMYVNQPTASNSDMYYVYSDHLGSILTVANGTNTYNQSFDAWGNHRNPTDGSYSNIPAPPAWMYRGYTGHEHLPDFQLINMNGRLYDPFNNSMLSPDVAVQNPGNTQNYNRYSYCLNNPLKYNDPSGFYSKITGNGNEGEIGPSATIGPSPEGGYGANDESLGDLNPYVLPNLAGGGFGGAGFGVGGGSMTDPIFETGGFALVEAEVNQDETNEASGAYIHKSFYTVGSDELGAYLTPILALQGVTTHADATAGEDAILGQQIESEGHAAYNDYIGGNKDEGNGSNWWQSFTDYMANVGTVAKMTAGWALGVGANSRTFTNDRVANAMRNSPGIIQARNDFYNFNKTSGSYQFGLKGLWAAGINPVEQFVGSYDYSISVTQDGLLQYTLSNNTSFSSFDYHLTPYSWNWNSGPKKLIHLS